MKIVSSTTNMVSDENEINGNNFRKLTEFLERHKNPNNSVLLSIVLPLYNEEKVIRKVIESMPKHHLIEIIIVNDNSTDKSLDEIKKAKAHQNLRIFHHKQNMGYGGAISTGMRHARGKVVVSMDSDGQHNAKDILGIIEPIMEDRSDLTIGSRYLGSYNYKLPLLRQIGEILAEKVIRVLFRLKIKNNQNGFRAYNRKILKLFKKARFPDYAFCTEQILKAKIYGFRIKECPIMVYGREHGASKITIIKLAFNIFSCLLIYYIKKIEVNLANKNNLLSIIF